MAKQTVHGRIRPVISMARRSYRQGRAVRLGEVFHGFGPGGATLAALVVALPFVSPLSLGPITTPASAFLIFLGWRLSQGRDEFPIPARWLAVPLPEFFFRLMRRFLAFFARRGRWHRQQIAELAGSRSFRIACGWGVLAGALLLAVPIPLLPLTNTFAALAIAAFCLAHLLHSRRLFIYGVASCIASVLVFTAIGTAFLVLGYEGFSRIVGW